MARRHNNFSANKIRKISKQIKSSRRIYHAKSHAEFCLQDMPPELWIALVRIILMRNM